jgi:hypothetical protein
LHSIGSAELNATVFNLFSRIDALFYPDIGDSGGFMKKPNDS